MKKILFVCGVVSYVLSMGQERKDQKALEYANTITIADLKEYLTVLASDEYEGRETGQKGQKMAAKYIADHFQEFGLTPVDKEQNYFQEFNLKEEKFEQCAINGDESVFENFYFYGLNNIKLKQAELVFGGYGIDHPKYSNYQNLMVKNKVVAFLEGEPFKDGRSLITGTDEYSEWGLTNKKKIDYAHEKGAKAVIIIKNTNKEIFETMGDRFKHHYQKSTLRQTDESEIERTVFYTHSKYAAELFGYKWKKFQKVMNKLPKNGNIISKVESSIVDIELRLSEKVIQTENVLGVVQGTDKAGEVLVITAHYDHIGISGNRVYNGADDDGSGTVAVMEMAEAFAKAKKKG